MLSQTATADFSPNIEHKYVLNALALSSVLGMFLPFPHSSRSMQLLGFLFLRSFKNTLSSSSSDYGFYLLSLGFPYKFYFFPILISNLFSSLSFSLFSLARIYTSVPVQRCDREAQYLSRQNMPLYLWSHSSAEYVRRCIGLVSILLTHIQMQFSQSF